MGRPSFFNCFSSSVMRSPYGKSGRSHAIGAQKSNFSSSSSSMLVSFVHAIGFHLCWSRGRCSCGRSASLGSWSHVTAAHRRGRLPHLGLVHRGHILHFLLVPHSHFSVFFSVRAVKIAPFGFVALVSRHPLLGVALVHRLLGRLLSPAGVVALPFGVRLWCGS